VWEIEACDIEARDLQRGVRLSDNGGKKKGEKNWIWWLESYD
jgi:hypothetical protein